MPMIHDVSTDPDDAPRFVALREARLKCKNGVLYSGLRSTAHRQRYADIEPAMFAQPPATIFQAALAVAKEMAWTIAASVEAESRIEATATTRIMRFKDDIVIRIRAEAGNTRLDIRSASRVGRTDLGANAKRIRAFLLELNNRLKTNT